MTEAAGTAHTSERSTWALTGVFALRLSPINTRDHLPLGMGVKTAHGGGVRARGQLRGAQGRRIALSAHGVDLHDMACDDLNVSGVRMGAG
jgi:hypothetical protein